MSSCCSTVQKQLHFVIIGGGSAAFSAALNAASLGARATIINSGLPIGGTCVNVGCVPSKTLIRGAETVHRASKSHFDGIETHADVTDFKAVIEQKRALVEGLRQAKYLDVISGNDNIQIISGKAKILSKNVVEVNSTPIEADRILIATGTHPYIPPIPGLEETGYLTSTSAFELEELPKSMIVLGGRYIALECAQMFARMGTKVTILQRSSRILPNETEDLTAALTEYLRSEGINIVTGVQIRGAFKNEGLHALSVEVGGAVKTFAAEKILVATGTAPNTRKMGLKKVGVERDDNGFIKVDDMLRTSIEGIYAAGDVIGEPKFVYTAAYEGGLAAQNALGSSPELRDYSALPWVIFTDPQVAGVGLDERMAQTLGINFQVSVLPLSQVPRSIAARDARGFIKLIRDKDTDLLIGARILAPEGSELLMQIVGAIKNKTTTRDLAAMFYPYLTLSEGVKLAALGFTQDIHKLSCCSSMVVRPSSGEIAVHEESASIKVKKMLQQFSQVLSLVERQKSLDSKHVQVHQAILRMLAEEGRPLSLSEIADIVGSDHVAATLKTLGERDLVILNRENEIVGAYPMTTEKTPHVVTINGHSIYAVCAFDALAISAMFKKKAVIDSECSMTRKPIQIKLNQEEILATNLPNIHVGIRMQNPGSCAAESICREMVFLENAKVAEEWRKHKENVYIFTLPEAVQLSINYFTPLLS
ncbi:mercuric reductase (plasmid) [Simkania negevensis Z]|uniref:Mercuric reductase n=2 Tax=Simkania negevensis TaxID=83561 RepID=F8L2V6_SIMNZ|nr:mercuric reductase [Simkania negevensis Z]